MAVIRDEGEIEFHLRIDGQPDDEFKVVKFDGFEAISELYEFDIELASENAEAAFGAIVGKAIALTIRGKMVDDVQQPDTYLHGIASRLEQTHIGERLTTYYMKLVPRFWTLRKRIDTRIFPPGLTAPQIVQQVFEDGGMPASAFRDATKGAFPGRVYCVQYQESDWDFASRLMEEEGIAYFFEHTQDDHVLVLANEGSAYAEIAGGAKIPFRQASGQETGEDSITDFRFAQGVRSGSVALLDYNFERPQTRLDAHAGEPADALAMFEFPGRYEETKEGKRLAQIRLEEQQATRQTATGIGSARRFLSGYRFTLAEHERGDLNRDYLLTRVEHHGYEPQARGRDAATPAGATGTPKYRNDFRCIPADVPFRPPRSTTRPYIRGTQSAVVVGPPGEEIYTDPYGRVKVQFHWDRRGQYDEDSSCWIRVAQSWAGAGWGANFIPRVGQEVLVSFLDGDPDRPYLVGSLYNNDLMPPYELPGEKSRSTIRSATLPGAVNFNEIHMEDADGAEKLYLYAGKDMHTFTREESREWVGTDRHLIVEGDQIEEVKGTKHLKVVGDRNQEVTGTISVDSMDWQQKAGAKYAVDAGNEIHLVSGMNVVIEGSVGITLKVGGNFVNLGPSGIFIQGTTVMINSGGAAGSGGGASPDSPDAPLEADDATGGETSQTPSPPPPPPAAVPRTSIQARALRQSAASGAPFCEKCEEARQQQAQAG